MAPPALPLFLLGLLCACSWIFAAASPILLVSNADKSPERNASSSGSLLTRQAGVPLYERCKQAGHLAMTFDDGPVRRRVSCSRGCPSSQIRVADDHRIAECLQIC
jgi:hypothetical protein